MAKATNAIAETFLSEGELSIDNSDKGGLTYLGVAFNKWPKAPFWGDIISVITSVAPSVSVTDLKNLGTGKGKNIVLTDAQTDQINEKLKKFKPLIIKFYKAEFWDTLNADKIISQTFAESFFDFCVNAGAPKGKKLLQGYLKTGQDGVIGNGTIGLLNSELVKNSFNVHIDFSLIKIRRYMEIVNNNNEQSKYLHGWLNRTFQVFNDEFSIDNLQTLRDNPNIQIEPLLLKDINTLLNAIVANNVYLDNKTSSELTKLIAKLNELIK